MCHRCIPIHRALCYIIIAKPSSISDRQLRSLSTVGGVLPLADAFRRRSHPSLLKKPLSTSSVAHFGTCPRQQSATAWLQTSAHTPPVLQVGPKPASSAAYLSERARAKGRTPSRTGQSMFVVLVMKLASCAADGTAFDILCAFCAAVGAFTCSSIDFGTQFLHSDQAVQLC
jgi:hypothetical protein